MAKLVGPLMSIDASGSLYKTLVFSKWKGSNYARLHVKPYNPKSAAQIGIRDTVSAGVFYFTRGSYVSAEDKALWNTYAEGTNMSGINRFMKFFVAQNYNTGTQTYEYAGIPDPQ